MKGLIEVFVYFVNN